MNHEEVILRRIVGYNLKRANSAVLATLQQVLGPLGLRRVTFSALAVIRSHPGLRQSDLAEILAIDRPNMVLIVHELEAAGFITRTRSQEDRRAYELRATPKGECVSEQSVDAVFDFDRGITEGIGEEERIMLIGLLNRIEANATAMGGEK
ncbi:MarR family transcriptional regulator [Rhodobacterales bacterium HKCCE2091]|nr:MarR family transcriptional regulator [Rhodobacterales bacterium HKCCE2091]